MNIETKQFMLNQLRDDFTALMQKIIQMPGSPVQKQHALTRFDEGHMWMQNAVISYLPPQPVKDEQKQISNDDELKQDEAPKINQAMQPVEQIHTPD